MNRKERRALKKQYGEDAVKKIQAFEDALSSMTTNCHSCGAPFDKNDKEALDNWHVSIDMSGNFSLTCPRCIVKEIKNA